MNSVRRFGRARRLDKEGHFDDTRVLKNQSSVDLGVAQQLLFEADEHDVHGFGFQLD